MKITVSFELDVSKNPSLNIPNLSELNRGLQNIGMFISELHTTNLTKLTKAMSMKGYKEKIIIDGVERE